MTAPKFTPDQEDYLRKWLARAKPSVVSTSKNNQEYLPGIAFEPFFNPDEHAHFVALLEKGAKFSIAVEEAGMEHDPVSQKMVDVRRVRLRSSSLDDAMPYMPPDVQAVWQSKADEFFAKNGGRAPERKQGAVPLPAPAPEPVPAPSTQLLSRDALKMQERERMGLVTNTLMTLLGPQKRTDKTPEDKGNGGQGGPGGRR